MYISFRMRRVMFTLVHKIITPYFLDKPFPVLIEISIKKIASKEGFTKIYNSSALIHALLVNKKVIY